VFNITEFGVETVERASGLKKGNNFSFFFDLKRAFETIDRQTLLQKLLCYGITEIEYEWFKSYLNLCALREV
jgi:hypothetical protein